MIKAYLDESGTHEGSHTCVIGGYVGTLQSLKVLKHHWVNALTLSGLRLEDFHAKDFVKKRDQWPLLRKLGSAIACSAGAYPILASVDIKDFKSFSDGERQFFTGALVGMKTGKMSHEQLSKNPYFAVFQQVIKIASRYAPPDEKVHFSFGLGRISLEQHPHSTHKSNGKRSFCLKSFLLGRHGID